jgi:hypothetical protein
LSGIGADKVIGIVPKDYFLWHSDDPTITGSTFTGFAAGLVVEGYWSTAAHELGHMYWIDEEEYETAPPDGREASGYFVEGDRSVDSICFMGSGDNHSAFLDRWVDPGHYVQLQNELRVSPDPEVILVTGFLHSSGGFEARPWYFRPDGFVTESKPGDGIIRVRTANGTILAEVTFPVSFTQHVEPLGVQPAEVVPLFITVPFPRGAVSVEILHKNQLINLASPTIKLLHDAIEAIPDFGFSTLASQRRRTLHARVNAIESPKAGQGMLGALNALRIAFVDWLRSDYVKTVPTQLTKDEVLRLVDAIIERMS